MWTLRKQLHLVIDNKDSKKENVIQRVFEADMVEFFPGYLSGATHASLACITWNSGAGLAAHIPSAECRTYACSRAMGITPGSILCRPGKISPLYVGTLGTHELTSKMRTLCQRPPYWQVWHYRCKMIVDRATSDLLRSLLDLIQALPEQCPRRIPSH